MLGRDLLISKKKLPLLIRNLGKQGKIIDSVIAGATNRSGEIIDVNGNDLDGYRYKRKLNEPIVFGGKIKFKILYPPVFLVEILN